MMVGFVALAVYIAMHVGFWLIGDSIAFWAGINACAAPPCASEIEVLSSALDNEPDLSLLNPLVLFDVIAESVVAFWNFISFGNYSFLRGGLGLPWDFIPLGIRLFGLGAGATGIMIISATVLGRR